jgi:hypothetical protein
MTEVKKTDIVVPPAVVQAVLSHDRVDEAPHSFYKYPARFSPLFAREAIKAFTQPGDTVIDPFCGGGTSLVEAISLGRRAAGFDISSLAVFLSRAKTSPLSVHDKREILAWADLMDSAKLEKVVPSSFDTEEEEAHYAPASQHWQCRVVASGPWPRKREGSAGPGQIPMPRRSLYKKVRPHGQPATHQVAAIRRTAIHNKERTPLRALVLVPAGISRRMFRCFRHTSPATLYLYFHIELSLSLL